MEEGHDVVAVGGTRYQAMCDGKVVAKQADAESGPLVTPGCICQDDGVDFFPLDTPSELGLSPAAVEPLSLAVGTEADGPRAVGEGQGSSGAGGKGATIPGGGKLSPPLQVEKERV